MRLAERSLGPIKTKSIVVLPKFLRPSLQGLKETAGLRVSQHLFASVFASAKFNPIEGSIRKISYQ
jgi:hypothetical protein